MLEGKALIEDTDMPVKMQLHAMASASQALDVYDVFDCKSIAAHIKMVLPFPSLNTPRNDFIRFVSCLLWSRMFYVYGIWQEFDKRYGGGWQCVVGSNFGCFFTHTEGTFIYFQLETLKFLIFKGSSSPPPTSH